MADIPRWRRYLRFWRSNVAADVDDEFRFHVQERIDDLIARGLSPAQARERALASFGNMEHIRDTCRGIAADQETYMRRAELLSVLRQDAIFALRQMRAAPALTGEPAMIDLSNGETTDARGIIRRILNEAAGYVDLSEERGHQGAAQPDANEEMHKAADAAGWE